VLAPYVDPVFQNNVILTQTERLTMSSRPKDPKTARNKNVLVIGGSGSGKGSISDTMLSVMLGLGKSNIYTLLSFVIV
jgi:hypothetical protein